MDGLSYTLVIACEGLRMHSVGWNKKACVSGFPLFALLLFHQNSRALSQVLCSFSRTAERQDQIKSIKCMFFFFIYFVVVEV